MAFSGNMIQQILPCCTRNRSKRLPQAKQFQRERVRFAVPPACQMEGLETEDEDKAFQENIPLQVQNDKDKLRRKSTLLSRTSSTKMTNTLYRTDSRNSRQYHLTRFSRENGYPGGNNAVPKWPPMEPPRGMTKICECRQCLKAMDHNKKIKAGLRVNKMDEGASRSSGSSSKNSSSSGSKRRTWWDSRKREKPSDNSYPFLSYKSFDPENDFNVKFTSV